MYVMHDPPRLPQPCSVFADAACRHPFSSRPARHWLRAGIAIVVVLVLHALAALWLTRNRESFTPPAPAEIPVQIELLKPRPIERQPAPKPVEPPAEHHAEPAPAKPAPAAPKHAPSPEPVLTSTQTAEHGEPPPAAAASAASGTAGASDANAAPAEGASSAATPGPATSGVKFVAPSSGDLQYDTFYNGMQNMIGTIHWRTDGHIYDLSVSMPVPFVGPFTYRSEGRIDAFGVAPIDMSRNAASAPRTSRSSTARSARSCSPARQITHRCPTACRIASAC